MDSSIDVNRLVRMAQATPAQQTEIDRILEGHKPTGSETRGPLLLGMSAAAKLLGCSRATLWRMCRSQKISRVEIMPGSFRIRRTDLEAIADGKAVTK